MNAKMGRPKTENPNAKNLTVRINQDLNERLNAYCEIKCITKGEVVRKGIELVISAEKK